MKGIFGILIWILVAVLWITPVILGIYQARKKNRSAHWMWFGIHPFSGWIMYVILLVSKPLRVCPNCKEKLKINAKNCPYCEHTFEDYEPSVAPTKVRKKWVLPVIAGGAGLLVLVGMFFAVFQLVDGMFTNSEPYKIAMSAARENLTVQDQIGADFKKDGGISGQAKFSGAEGNAEMAVPIRGAKGTGVINIVAEEKGGKWVFTVLNLNHNGVFVDFLAK